MSVQITERERLLVALATIGIGSITVLSVTAQLQGIDGTCFAASLSAIVGIICSVGGILYGRKFPPSTP